MSPRILPAMVATTLFLLLIPAASPVPDSMAVRIDSAFRLLNAGKTDSAATLAKTINPRTLSPALRSHASRLGIAGLQARPGSPVWIDWMMKFSSDAWSPEEKIWIARVALDAGLSSTASTLLGTSPPENPALRHSWEILQTRLSASAGGWKNAEARLKDWKNDPKRREGSGEIFFWQGWAALHQHRREEADTLFTLASSYADEPISQRALEYRYAVLLDTGEALYAYVRGLPESPLPDSMRKASLEHVSTSSALHPHALWEIALISEKTGNREGELEFLQALAMDPSSLAGRRASTRLTRLKFEPDQPDSAMNAYEHLLLQYQQGVPSEFARSRVQTLRAGKPQKNAP